MSNIFIVVHHGNNHDWRLDKISAKNNRLFYRLNRESICNGQILFQLTNNGLLADFFNYLAGKID